MHPYYANLYKFPAKIWKLSFKSIFMYLITVLTTLVEFLSLFYAITLKNKIKLNNLLCARLFCVRILIVENAPITEI